MDLNKYFPKDPVPLPYIESFVDATVGHEILTFMDILSGFQQLQVEPLEQEETTFRTQHMYNVIQQCLLF